MKLWGQWSVGGFKISSENCLTIYTYLSLDYFLFYFLCLLTLTIKQAYFPKVTEAHGFPIIFQDTQRKEWEFNLRFWVNCNSKMYVLEGLKEYMTLMQWQAGDKGKGIKLEIIWPVFFCFSFLFLNYDKYALSEGLSSFSFLLLEQLVDWFFCHFLINFGVGYLIITIA